MSEHTSVTTPVTGAPLRPQRYYEKVSYPMLLLQLLSRATQLLSRPPRHSSDNALALIGAVDTILTIYYSLPEELRESVDDKLRRDYAPVVKALEECREAWEQAVTKVAILDGKKIKIKRVNNITQLSMLPKLRASVSPGILPLFLDKFTRYVLNEDGFIVGADLLDLTPCAEAVLGNTSVTPSDAIEALVKLYAKMVQGRLIAPNQVLIHTCATGLRLRAQAALHAIINVLNEAGLLLEKGEVWVGEA